MVLRNWRTVLDEADRILDMGFSASLNAIIANLPKSRQTLLFSATQTKSVKDLARLSLQAPEYVAVRENNGKGKEKAKDGEEEEETMEQEVPSNLEQHYMVVDLPSKLDVLWTFIKTHLFTKTIVFLSSGKQVKLSLSLPSSLNVAHPNSSRRCDSYTRTFVICDLVYLYSTCTGNKNNSNDSKSTNDSYPPNTRSCSPPTSPHEDSTSLRSIGSFKSIVQKMSKLTFTELEERRGINRRGKRCCSCYRVKRKG